MAGFWNKTGQELKILRLAALKGATDNMNDLAAAIAFWAFLSMFPLLIGVFSLAGYLLDSNEVQVRANQFIAEMLPGTGEFVQNTLDATMKFRGAMSWVSILGLLWTVSKAFGVITRAANREHGKGPPIRSYLLAKLQHFIMATALSVMMVASIGVSMLMEVVFKSTLLERLGLEDMEISRLRGWTISSTLVFCTFLFIYKMAPRVRIPWRKVLPGALLGSICFEIAKVAFVFYLKRIGHVNAIYGSISSLMVLLFWLYLSALILVYGAYYNAARWRLRHPDMDESTVDM